MSQNPASSGERKGGRYRSIIASIVFLVLVVGTLVGYNIYVAGQLSQSSKEVNLAGRQRMLSQRTAKLVNALEAAQQGDSVKVGKQQKELLLTHTLFDRTLKAFMEGGMTVDADGKTEVPLTKVSSELLQRDLSDAFEIWSALSPGVLMMATQEPVTWKKNLTASTVNLTRENNLLLLKLMNNLTLGLDKNAIAASGKLKTVQGFCLALVLANFGFLVFYALRSLRQGDDALEERSQKLQVTNLELEAVNTSLGAAKESLGTRAEELEKVTTDLTQMKEESDAIFGSVDHGLCLINREYVIGRRVSSSMYQIFEKEYLSGLSLVDLLRPLLTEKDITTLGSYLELQFANKASRKQLDKFNPLKQVEVTLDWDGKGFSNKHLGFRFERVVVKDEVVSVLVTVTDVTEQVALESNLKRASQDQERKTDLTMEIIHVDPDRMKVFMAKSQQELEKVNALLKESDAKEEGVSNGVRNRELVDEIFAIFHNIKGNASMIGLKAMVRTCHKIEEDLNALKPMEEVNGDEFLSALLDVAKLKEMMNDYDEIGILFADHAGSRVPSSDRSPEPAVEVNKVDELRRMAADICQEEGKKVFIHADLPFQNFGDQSASDMQDVLIQLIRNSLVHGIERPTERLAMNKLDVGAIYIDAREVDAEVNPLGVPAYKFTYRDDGRGLDTEALGARAVKLGLCSKRAWDKLSEEEKVLVIFDPKFSSQEVADEYSGRGLGMSIIKQKIKEDYLGRLGMSFAKGVFTEFSWYIAKELLVAEEEVATSTRNQEEVAV